MNALIAKFLVRFNDRLTAKRTIYTWLLTE